MNFERCRFVAEMVGVASIVAVLRYQPRIAFTLCRAVCFDASHHIFELRCGPNRIQDAAGNDVWPTLEPDPCRNENRAAEQIVP